MIMSTEMIKQAIAMLDKNTWLSKRHLAYLKGALNEIFLKSRRI